MQSSLIEISNIVFQYGNHAVLKNFSWKIKSGEHWMIGGPSGTGKTTLAKIIAGILLPQEGKIVHHLSAKEILYVPNWYQFTNLEGDRNFYYQQRYNQFAKNDTLTVGAELKQYAQEHHLSFDEINPILSALDFEQVQQQQLIELSSGEHKKLQLIKALWRKPSLLIIDQPYTGLDANTRKLLNELFNQYTAQGTTLIIINNDNEYPNCITHFAEIQNGELITVSEANKLSQGIERTPKPLPYFLQQSSETVPPTLVAMKNVSVTYGEKEVLKNINWKMKAGEQWLLQGPNGSGKSTLLSLLNGDHPQAYANDIYLFGKKRGSGESIWDIKAKVGIISPELHWYYDMQANVAQTVASGFFDSMSLYQNINYEQQQQLSQLLYFFDLQEDKNKKMHTLPLGKQRLALLARTIIKKPELLILDEPFQGLDQAQTRYFNEVIDELCRYGQSLIYVGHFESQLPSCISHKLIIETGVIKATKKVAEKILTALEQ